MLSATRRTHGRTVNGLLARWPDSKSIIDNFFLLLPWVLDRFAENLLPHTDPMVRLRFLDAFQRYTDAVVKRNSDKDHHRVRSVEEYFTLRRETIAYKTVFALCLIDIDIPEEVLNHPHILLLEQAALDMMIISNDLCSYNVESVVSLHLHHRLPRGLTYPQTREG
jgi:hypothetical protein